MCICVLSAKLILDGKLLLYVSDVKRVHFRENEVFIRFFNANFVKTVDSIRVIVLCLGNLTCLSSSPKYRLLSILLHRNM